MPCFFQASRCAASDELAISTAWTLLAYSWPMRWNTRSAPVRSTRTSMPPNFSLNAPAIFSATERSIAVYQTTLPSFLAASISCSVIASAGGASARTADANTVPSASALAPFSEPCRTSRLESFRFFIASSRWLLLSAQRPATLGRQREPNLGTRWNGVLRRRNDAQGRAISRFDHIVAAGAEKHLPRHGGLDGIPGRLRRLRRKRDVVLADGDRGTLAGFEFCTHHLQGRARKRDMTFVRRGALDHVA